MSRNGNGTYSLPAGNPVVTGTTISSTWANNTLGDIATALTQSLANDGQTLPVANLPMSGFKHTDVAAATSLTDYLRADQAQNSIGQWLTSVTGTDTITGSPTIAPSAYAAGQTFRFVATGTNTTLVTLNVASLGAKSIKKRMAGGKVDLVANDIISGIEYSVTYDGTDFVLNEQRPYAQGANVASAATINLNTATGDYVHITGTTTITAITLAQGEQRTIVFDDALTFTNGASLILPGGANIPTAAGDVAVVRGEASNVVRCIEYIKKNGQPVVASPVAQIQPISASVSANALTISASSLKLDFRSTTLGSGTVTTVTGTPANLVISSGSTLGTVNAVASRIVVLAINNAGTIELAAVNISGGNQLDETNLISTTAEGGSGGADSANVFYSTAARTNVAYRVIGFIDSTQATAGTWATAPSLIQGQGGQALASLSSIGYGQTWQNVTASRALSTTYYNTTGRPIQIYLSATTSPTVTVTVNGTALGAVISPCSMIIPTGASYSVAFSGGVLGNWNELR